MAKAGDTIENRWTGQRITFVRTSADTGGEVLELESLMPGGGPMPPSHLHPGQAEHFEVLEGEVEAGIGGERRVYGAGERFDIPAGTPHDMRAAADADARVKWETRPALRTEHFLEAAFGPEPGPHLLEEYAAEFRLAELEPE
ncbi:MAG: cupin domain-containing protein [Thermoleophilaceae bacterium]|nr:cupin domain-containing protein [Thermoleophilaceae bacterium]